jgi:DNA polymerase
LYNLKELEEITKKCCRCPLSKTRTNVVFGEGNKRSDIVFIGEAPGYHEDQSGKHFVGRSGELFDKMLDAVDIARTDVYITNIIKCRPPNNRTPLENECKNCIEFLRWQIKIIDPGIIVCLGAVAARNIIQKDFKISKSRGTWYQKGKFNIIATYHPSAVLRDISKEQHAMEDFISIKNMYDIITRKM